EKYHIAGACFCERCLLDITALALNRLPPRYVVCDQGEAYVRTGFLDQQFEVDVLYAILEAIRVVQENPRH
ncbi:MAG: late competence development ComFB family protein, partial [Firmicutes bacterium]|nr:late competence development ComFB family protein [Bacillota bacterium]